MDILITYRKQKGMTQTQLADALGVSQSMICEIETGRKRVGVKTAIKWSELTNGELPRHALRPDVFSQ